MAIINPNVNTNIETPIPEQGGLKGFLAGLENASKEKIAHMNSAAKMAAILQSQKRGDTKETAAEHAKLGSEYDKLAKKYEPIINRVEIGTRALDRGDALGVNQAIVSLAGTTEGASQRILQSVIQKFGGSPTIMGSADKVASFMDGLQRSGKSPAFTDSLRSALQDIHTDAKNAYSKDISSFKSKAPGIAPLSSQNPAFAQEVGNYGGAIDSRIADLDKSFAAKAAPAPTTPPPNEGILGKAGGALSGLMGYLAGPSAKAAPVTPPPGPLAQPGGSQGPQIGSIAPPVMAAPPLVPKIKSFEEWKKDKAAEKLARGPVAPIDLSPESDSEE